MTLNSSVWNGVFPHRHLHRLVRILYNIRKPHCRQRTGSPLLILFRAPQSPQRYSTPRNCNNDDTAAAGDCAPADVVAAFAPVPFILLPGNFYTRIIDIGFGIVE